MATAKQITRFLKRKGFKEKRQTGSHLVLKSPATGHRAVVPIHRGDLPKGLFLRILKDAGFSLEDYLEERKPCFKAK
ncbi:MAG: type II toxin-antitoxin system HicA family toxin [Acidobacteriota bacterium]|nr:MAG: type II toxin-antitoxin system HicA family toxin [Acidobacteriota bacterium]